MGGNKNKKRRTTKKNKTATKKPEIQTIKVNPIWSFIKRFWGWIVSFSVVIGLILDYQQIKNMLLSPQKQYEQNYFYKGDLSPEKISDDKTLLYKLSPVPPNFNYVKKNWLPLIPGIAIKFNPDSMLHIFVGQYNFYCPKTILEKGVSLHLPNTCDTTSLLSLGVKDDRIYVSVQFDDLQKEETVGYITYNHWTLYRPNMFDFQTDGKRYLQVEDLKNNIIFSIHYWKGVDVVDDGVFIAGYFLESKSVTVIPNFRYGFDHITCYLKDSPEWKEHAYDDIRHIIKRVDTLAYKTK
ncbi:hypothetical protein [Mucilaginibacter sp. L196]|uniref:hypothetical protein n=1 Tax=Mucilaginibacter sp. L196 TaxID=1641870 RepID=UPI00131E7E1A|nr:hypothetical protein [Mucilaginibacter sp. L196]